MIKSSILADFFKLVAAFVIVWAVFTLVADYIPGFSNVEFKKSSESLGISIENEERIGDLILEMYLADKTIVSNTTLDSGLLVIYNRLMEGLEESKYEIKFYVVESEMVNAMTFPGGNVVINTSLIEFSDSPEEFAAVVAHEIGHTELRHVIDRMAAEVGMTVLVSLITGGDATVIHEAIGAFISNAFSRSQESEADLFGMELLERSHIDPKSIGQFFERLNESNLGFGERLELLMSHPHNNSRLESSLQYQIEEGFSSRPLPLDWNRIKASL